MKRRTDWRKQHDRMRADDDRRQWANRRYMERVSWRLKCEMQDQMLAYWAEVTPAPKEDAPKKRWWFW